MQTRLEGQHPAPVDAEAGERNVLPQSCEHRPGPAVASNQSGGPAQAEACGEKRATRCLEPASACNRGCYDSSVTREVGVTARCRVVLDTNRYSVPSRYASQGITLKVFADRLCLYHAHNL
ncbi:MAG: hypothetical protein WCP35_17145, partial [Verrucomicrobiota bacterium]